MQQVFKEENHQVTKITFSLLMEKEKQFSLMIMLTEKVIMSLVTGTAKSRIQLFSVVSML